MGSTNFEKVHYRPVSAQEAYSLLCEEAADEDGHSGYSGTIATTQGVRVHSVVPVTLAQARKAAEPRLDHLNKWDVCEAIALVHEEPARYVGDGEREVTLTLSGEDFNDPQKVTALLAKTLKVKPEQIERFTSSDPKTYRNRVAAEPRVEAEVPKEKTETRFFILSMERPQMPRWENGHPSQAAARAALPSMLGADFGGSLLPATYEIIGITRRVSGDPLVKAVVSAKKVTVTYTVSLRKKVSDAVVGTERAGWYFYGWAAS